MNKPNLLEPGTVFLDTSRRSSEDNRNLLFSNPKDVLVANTPDEVLSIIKTVDDIVERGYYVAGYLGYEAGYILNQDIFGEDAAFNHNTQPLVWFGVYDAPLILTNSEVDRCLSVSHDEGFYIHNAVFSPKRADFHDKLAAIKSYIYEGDVYQINFTGKVRFDFKGSPLALYRDLRKQQRVRYGAVLSTGRSVILSCSPELFFCRHGDTLYTRPMKGTVKRGKTASEDAALQAWLSNDKKNRAENLMIVDLLRNDLSVCCTPGSVQVLSLFDTELYETVIQMTSGVSGRLETGIQYFEVFKALFPCGSVTGAPKLRAMQLIRDLESGSRGVYCGAIGYISPEQEATFNVAIRTVTLEDGKGEMGAGSGIVWESDVEDEYDECLLKAQFLTDVKMVNTPPFELIETMRWEKKIDLMDDHCKRFADSASYFAFPFNEAVFRNVVKNVCDKLKSDAVYKIRVTLNKSGHFFITSSIVKNKRPNLFRLYISPVRVESSDIFLRHKTTRRTFFDESCREARKRGFDEVIFLNERGEITQGSRTNIFLKKGDKFYTPPLSCGLLNGIYRSKLLEGDGAATERVLFRQDLLQADEIYLCNAVHGLVKAYWMNEVDK